MLSARVRRTQGARGDKRTETSAQNLDASGWPSRRWVVESNAQAAASR